MSRQRPRSTPSYVVPAAVALAAGLLLAGCSSGSDDGGTSGDAAGSDAAAESEGSADGVLTDQEAPAGRTEVAGSDSLSAFSAARRDSDVATDSPGTLDLTTAQLDQRDVIRTGTLSMESEDPQQVRDEIGEVVTAANGYIADESAQARPEGGVEEIQVVLRVPVDSFDEVVADIERLGKRRSLALQAQDVTAEVADVGSRVQSARAALERVRALLDRATSLGSVIRLEGVLSNRQADLEALLAREQALAGQTSLATLEVFVDAPVEEVKPAPVEKPDETEGFGDGLAAGWNAMSDAFVVMSTVAGALLPWAVLAAVCLVPVLAWRRRRITPATPEPTPAE